MKTLFVMASLILALTASAQAPDTLWTTVVGTDTTNEYIRSIRCTSDGGFIVAGTSEYNLVHHWMLFKLSNTGALEEIRTYGGESNAECHVFAYEAPDFGYYLVREESNDFCLTKVSISGDSLWSRYYGNPEWPESFKAAAVAADGGCLLMGETMVVDGLRGYFVRLDANADTLWTRMYGQVGDNLPLAGIEDANGGWWVSIWHTAWPVPDGSLLRLSADGDSLWSRNYDRSTFHTLIALTGGGLAMAGYVENLDRTIVRVDDSGDILWSHNYYDPDMYGPPQVVAEDVEAGQPRIVAAFAGCYAEMPRLALMATELDGDTGWSQMYGPDLISPIIHSACANPDWGGYLLAGDLYTGPETWNLYFARVGPLAISVDEPSVPLPTLLSLSAYPNPFNPVTTLSLDWPHSAVIKLAIFDVLGRNMRTVTDEWLPAGHYSFSFDASALPSGIYFARVQAGEIVQTQKLLLLK